MFQMKQDKIVFLLHREFDLISETALEHLVVREMAFSIAQDFQSEPWKEGACLRIQTPSCCQ